jgi:putative PIN family toxin of toxin-antitoxin system
VKLGAVVIDTNVVVAGLLAAQDNAAVAQILDGMLSAAFPFAVSPALLAEYHEVLVRPQIRKLHGLTIAEVEAILTDIAQHAIVIDPGRAGAAPDPGDPLLWDLLSERSDLVLVTGDKLLLTNEAMQGRVVSPRSFVDSR